MADEPRTATRAAPAATSSTRPPDWANDPRQASMAETLLWRAMQRHDLRMLATYVTFLLEKGVDLRPLYDRVRQEFPETPTLAELQEKIATARARQA